MGGSPLTGLSAGQGVATFKAIWAFRREPSASKTLFVRWSVDWLVRPHDEILADVEIWLRRNLITSKSGYVEIWLRRNCFAPGPSRLLLGQPCSVIIT
jgi:hypothetical protein